MTPHQLVEIVKDLLDHKPEVIEHLRVWAGLDTAFPCSEIEKEDVMRLAEGLGLITIAKTPTLTPTGLLALQYTRGEID